MTAFIQSKLSAKHLYLVINNWNQDSDAGMSHIEGMSGGVFDDSPLECQRRIGSKLYNKISNVLKRKIRDLDLSILEYEFDEDLIDTVTGLLDSDQTIAFSPMIKDFSDAKLVGNIDFLLLPSNEKKDISGAYEISEQQTAYILYSGELASVTGLSEHAEMFDDDTDSYMQLMELLDHTVKTLKGAFDKHLKYFRMFMLNSEWENRQSFDPESLPHSMSFKKKNKKLHVTIPGFMSYHMNMYNEDMILAYYNTRQNIARWFDLQVCDIFVNVKFDYELVGFKVAENVWIESVFNPNLVGNDLDENRYWWDSEDTKMLTSKKHDANTVAQWLKSEGATNVAYFSFLEHHDGNEVAYAVSVFKGRVRIIQFTVSAFDWAAGAQWMHDLKTALGLPFVCSDVKEDDWDIVELDENYPYYVMPQAPLFAKERYSIISLFFMLDDGGYAPETPPKMHDIKEFPEILSLGLNAPLDFNGYISTPYYAKEEDFDIITDRSRDYIEEMLEDGLTISDDCVAQKLHMEFRSKIENKKTKVGVMSTIILLIPQTTLLDYVMSKDLPCDLIDNPALLKRFNDEFPQMKITKIVMFPLMN